MFWICSRIFSISALQVTTSCEISASLLCAERVQFATDFLAHEFERAADRLVLAQVMRELREVAFQPRQFLGDVGPVREEDDFLHQSLVVERQIESGPLDALVQRGRYFFTRRAEARGSP